MNFTKFIFERIWNHLKKKIIIKYNNKSNTYLILWLPMHFFKYVLEINK